ncbi:MAG TPA: GNAT family N-acetyltransferase [Stellaceae bacterium]|nr:GNAT family N-acetyltransferase [Stellaceae bacterium]
MSEPTLTLGAAADPADAEAIQAGLARFNAETAGYVDAKPLTVVARDPLSGAVVGGILGRTSFGLLFVDTIHLDRRLRGAGIGSRMLAMAEEEARRRGCRRAVLYTISFQAPGFYARNGWRTFGEIPCEPPGTSRVFMTKEL